MPNAGLCCDCGFPAMFIQAGHSQRPFFRRFDGVDDQQRFLQKKLRVLYNGEEVYQETVSLRPRNGSGGFTETGDRAFALQILNGITLDPLFWTIGATSASRSFAAALGTATVTLLIDLLGPYTYEQRNADLRFLVNWTGNPWLDFPPGTNYCVSHYNNDTGTSNLLFLGGLWFSGAGALITLPDPASPFLQPLDDSHIKEFSLVTGSFPFIWYRVTNHLDGLNADRMRLVTAQTNYCRRDQGFFTDIRNGSQTNRPTICSTVPVSQHRIDLPMSEFPNLIWDDDYSEDNKEIFIFPGAALHAGPPCNCF